MEFGGTHRSAKTAATLALELSELGLLVRREDLVKSRLGFRLDRGQLGGKSANGCRRLVDGGCIVTGYRGLERLVGGLHAAVHGRRGGGSIGENSSGLLLLRGREGEERRQKADSVLYAVAVARRRSCGRPAALGKCE